eukprot:scaffold4461_cov263-Pinguiococcus_pyrenoidosus.AAC.3
MQPTHLAQQEGGRAEGVLHVLKVLQCLFLAGVHGLPRAHHCQMPTAHDHGHSPGAEPSCGSSFKAHLAFRIDQLGQPERALDLLIPKASCDGSQNVPGRDVHRREDRDGFQSEGFALQCLQQSLLTQYHSPSVSAGAPEQN